jgi:hypothetical protein
VTEDRKAELLQRRRGPWLVCAALAVVFGRGPVPWIHTHETLARHGHFEDALAWHVRHFHQSDNDDHGWHIHWTLPWHIVNCPCQHDSAPAEERASAVEMPFDVAQSAAVIQADVDVHASSPPAMLLALDGERRPRWGPQTASGLHFLETYLPTVSLRALYCVALC